jgi:mono/diheme cytochrome c family protein
MIRAAWLGALALVFAGCMPGSEPGSEYMPDMARGPAYKAFAPNPATRDGRTLMRPVAGTIARGRPPLHFQKTEEDALRAGHDVPNPYHPTPDVLEKGKALYEIYCQVCHGAEGKGNGPIAGKIPPPPSYKSERVIAFLPGRIFHVISMGSNKMPSYSAQLAPDERWQIVTYVRTTLQGLGEVP